MSHKAKDKEEEVQLDTKNIVSLRSNVFNPTITENEEEENEDESGLLGEGWRVCRG